MGAPLARIAAASLLAFAACKSEEAGAGAEPAPTIVVEVRGELNVAVQARVARAIREAQSVPGSVVVLALDTPGGEVTTMGEIGDALRRASAGEKGLQTVAFVEGGPNGGAFSAGSYLAISCTSIYMAKGTSIGGALPVVPAPIPGGGFGIAAADDLAEGKIVATLAARFRAVAEQTGRPPGVAAAFVDPQLGVYRVRLRSGSEAVLDTREIEALSDQGEMVERLREIQPPGIGRPLVLSADEAFAVGIAQGRVDGLDGLLRALGREAAPRVVLEATSGERLVRFLDTATPALLLLGIVLGFLEAKIPGFGLAGILSTICFGLVFYGRFLLGAAEWLEGLLFVLGLALVAVELFLAPGTLYAGVLGALLIAAGLFLSFQSFLVPRDALDLRVLTHNLAWGSGIFLASCIAILALSRFLPHSPVVVRLALAPPSGLEGTATEAARDLPLVGRVVLAASDLRPAGVIEADGRRVDAVTEGGYISRGSAVRVLGVDGNRVIVAPEPGIRNT